MNIVSIRSNNPYRVTITGDTSPSTAAADYAISRLDNGPLAITVSSVWRLQGNVVELALSDKMLDDVTYVLTYQGVTSATISYRDLLVPTFLTSPTNDPEAEVFGVDIDWLSDSLTGTGDTPTIRGRQCVVNDLAAIAVTSKGELFHRPDEGGGLIPRVNSPNLPISVSELTADIKRQWARDSRVVTGGIEIKSDVSTVGQITVSGKVQTIAIDDPLTVKIPGGST